MKLFAVLACAVALLGVAELPINGTVTEQNPVVHIQRCEYLPDGVVRIEVTLAKNIYGAIVRVRTFDGAGRWIADDLVLVRGEWVASEVERPMRGNAPARAECRVDSIGESFQMLVPRDRTFDGDLAPCAQHVPEFSTDSGPDGEIDSISIGNGWMGISFDAYVNMFFPASYGKLHNETYSLLIDGHVAQTLRANGMSQQLEFFKPIPAAPHVVTVVDPRYAPNGWIACLNRVVP